MQPIPAQRIEFSAEDRSEILARIDKSLSSGSVAQGTNVSEFENAVARATGARHAVAVASGGAALEVLGHVLDVRNQEVIVPTNTFIATASAVLLNGGFVRLADVDGHTFSLTLDSIRAARTSKTVGIIIVHVGGIISPEIEAISHYCKQQGLWLIEDCAHAHGSTFNNISAGRFGIAGAYSFFATKVVTSGEGGMIVTDDDTVAERARRFRDYGKSQQWVTVSDEVGANRRMSEFCAAVGLIHFGHLHDFTERRANIASHYSSLLRNVEEARPAFPQCASSWYKYIVLLSPRISRDIVRRELKARGIDLAGGVYDIPLHRQPALRNLSGTFPSADDICGRHICLPIYASMGLDEAEFVIRELLASFSVAATL